jgi:hypothetical protein
LAEKKYLYEYKIEPGSVGNAFLPTAFIGKWWADFSQTLAQEISPGKALKLSARAAKLYLMQGNRS